MALWKESKRKQKARVDLMQFVQAVIAGYEMAVRPYTVEYFKQGKA